MFRGIVRKWLGSVLIALWALTAQAQSADRINQLVEDAGRGSNAARFTLGTLYKSGDGVTRNYARANEYYRQAATEGYAPAQNNLGWSYREGLGVAKDGQQALYWFKKSALQGNALALQNIGEMYRDGDGVPRDARMALDMFVLCAGQKLNQAKSEGGFDSAVLECRRDLGKYLLGQDADINNFRTAVVLFALAMQPNKDDGNGSRAPGRAARAMQEARALYDANYPKLDARGMAWVREILTDPEALLSLMRGDAGKAASLR